MIKVLIVDDHDLMRIGIKKLLSDVHDIEVSAEAESGEEALELLGKLTIDVVLMDINMPGIGGLEATHRAVKRYPSSKILAVTAYGEEPLPSKVIQAGALGYITKGTSLDEMVQAIRTVAKGHKYIGPEVAQQLALKSLSGDKDNPFDCLSEREMQIMIMITSGQKVAEISEQLFISAKTVNTYRYRLFEKLEVNSDVELTHLALRYKLITPISDGENL